MRSSEQLQSHTNDWTPSVPDPMPHSSWSAPLWAERHHLFADLDDRRVLVDTGSPGTLAASALGSIVDRVGVDFESLLGMDQLAGLRLDFDLPGGRISAGPDAVEDDAVGYPCDSIGGVPIFEAEVEGEVIRGVFDTGSSLCYLPAALLERSSPVGQFEDFHPLLAGSFRTTIHRTVVTIGGIKIQVPAGKLPPDLQPLLEGLGAKAIIGLPVLRGRRLWLDVRGGWWGWNMLTPREDCIP